MGGAWCLPSCLRSFTSSSANGGSCRDIGMDFYVWAVVESPAVACVTGIIL